MKANRNLLVAKSKVKYFNGQTWCGYLTPSEIKALLENGAKEENGGWKSPFIMQNLRKGISNPTWFYFIPSDKLRKFLQNA